MSTKLIQVIILWSVDQGEVRCTNQLNHKSLLYAIFCIGGCQLQEEETYGQRLSFRTKKVQNSKYGNAAIAKEPNENEPETEAYQNLNWFKAI